MTTSCKIYPVIHYANDAQTLHNAEIAVEAGCPGAFLIDMDAGRTGAIVDVASDIADRWPGLDVGVNFLGVDPRYAVLASMNLGLAMTWIDEQVTHSGLAPWHAAQALGETPRLHHKRHSIFVAVDFKYQPAEPNPGLAARKAAEFSLIPTTSGPGTGMPADPSKIASLREAIGFAGPLAIASGITPTNVHHFAPHVTHMLVATGISSSFYTIDPAKLSDLCAAVQS